MARPAACGCRFPKGCRYLDTSQCKFEQGSAGSSASLGKPDKGQSTAPPDQPARGLDSLQHVPETAPSHLTGPVLVVGAGLIGTSIALAARRAGIEVLLHDVSEDNVRTASGLGAGHLVTGQDRPQLVVVAVPPDHLAAVVRRCLEAYPDAVVTDVGSVKSGPLTSLAGHPGLPRYVGSHPMAGSERSGPLAASAALFDGRPWAITPGPGAGADAVQVVELLVQTCNGVPVRLSPSDHDRAVARTSHVPHLMSALVAGTLTGALPEHLALSGQGVRDVTRVAGGDPDLYSQIIGNNAASVADLLREVRDRLDLVLDAVEQDDRASLASLLEQGVAGTRAIPGKHGGPTRPTVLVRVAVPDHPGELARLFADVRDSRVNIEDVRIDHDPGRPFGLVELDVAGEQEPGLLAVLESRGWVTHR